MDLYNNPPKWLRYGLGFLQLFISIGAVAGGIALISTPDGSALGLPPELLEQLPFRDYFIPGLVLLIVNGLGSLIGGILTLRRYQLAGEIAIALGIFLVLWIMSQVVWFQAIFWLHVVYFIIGAVEVWLGLRFRKEIIGLNKNTSPAL